MMSLTYNPFDSNLMGPFLIWAQVSSLARFGIKLNRNMISLAIYVKTKSDY